MTTHLDVLLIERRPGTGSAGAEVLEAAGHRVHRCYPDPGDGRPAGADPSQLCLGAHGTCPLTQGIDVAMLARKGIAVRPTFSESGAVCAIRAGVPLVEDGSDLFDAFGPWLAGRVDDDVVGACEAAASSGFGPLEAEVRHRTARSLAAAGIDPASVGVRFETDGPHLTVVIVGPPTTRPVQQALGVRALDAVRTTRRTFAKVDVTYEPTSLGPPAPAPPTAAG